MIKIHELKTDPDVFAAVWEEKKTYEIRLNDRDFQEKDVVILRETKYTGQQMYFGKPLEYTGRVIHTHITHVLRGPIYGLHNKWCILSLANERIKFVSNENANSQPA